ncbi:MAG: discoidin domain-containing protein, partial [Muribaculaceae bacterium]|nr:discoidin domain-containing protein [Muribaculaceae bacterium]
MRKMRCLGSVIAALMSVATMQVSVAQQPVIIGGGSISSAPPTYKAKTVQSGPGFNATAMLSRKIYAEELPATADGALQVPGRPIPTNDWWTDVINNRYSGALWSYPAMLRTSEEGVEIKYPTYWADAGKEVKSRSSITVGASDYRADAAIARDWHDWDVVMALPNTDGDGEMVVTAVHGSPFTWIEFNGLTPELQFSATPTLFGQAKGYLGVKIGDDHYGIYCPEWSHPTLNGEGVMTFAQETPWVVVALLRNAAELDAFARYATSIPRDTRVEWVYQESTATVNTTWHVEAENLRDRGASAPVLQGFLPHAYKYALAGSTFGFIDNQGILTPRGTLLYGASESGTFAYSYRFSGMLPAYAAPDATVDDKFKAEVLRDLMKEYASKGTFGGDTYWGGKGLVQMALNMSFAKQVGDEEIYEQSKSRLKEALSDWLMYTPGEDSKFFSYYPRWGAMLGFDVSYDSDAFNDHHFHYGYFIYAAALLCMEDKQFAADYGDILTMIAKDYANWDRSDARFPFMRTLDPWCGHSWAGGLGDHGNDNGNGQESSSEAMQSWGGLYLLGVALGNREMRDAGIWGWTTEAHATREYWYDVDAPRPANDGGRKAWPGKGDRKGNYDYSEYPYAYNSNITGKGIGWWTWFGGDPLFMHGIQWMPISPALDYLSWDTDFVSWALDDMLSGANSSYSHSWFDDTYNADNGERIEPLAYNDWGNVALSYMQRYDPAGASDIFDEALRRRLHIATSVSTSHISYFVIHSHLTYGDPDFSVHADMPTAQMTRRNGVAYYLVYNPDADDRIVRFYDANNALIKSVNAPAERFVAISADPVATLLRGEVDGGAIIPPGESALVCADVLDQYGAKMTGEPVSMTLSQGAPASISGRSVVVDASAARGSKFSLWLTSGSLRSEIEVTVNDRPVAASCTISGVPDMIERGNTLELQLNVTDQYGTTTSPSDVRWTAVDDQGSTSTLTNPASFNRAGVYTIQGISAASGAKATARLFVTPTLPLISLNANVMASSAENVGTLPSGAVDGNVATRWGSAHTADEWLVVDLGEQGYLSRVAILWEAAYAKRYEVQTARFDAPTKNITVNYAGTWQSITVPVDDAWVTVADEQLNSAGEKVTPINTSARYLRIKGVERATSYGYSLYEIGIYGIKGSIADDALIGIDFPLPQAIDSGETIKLDAVGYQRDGRARRDIAVSWSADKEATFAGNDFTPTSHGIYTLTAAVAGAGSSTGYTFVNEVERPVSVTFDTDIFTVIAGHATVIPYTVMNQFLAPYTGQSCNIHTSVLDDNGYPTIEAQFDVVTGLFTSNVRGIYTIEFEDLGSCKVKVINMSELNLALNKRATASSVLGGNKAAMAVDGNSGTRWESEWSQPHHITVDLGKEYNVDRVVIDWEGAYARRYRLQSSTDGATWSDFYTDAASKGGREEITFQPVKLRHLRVCCDDRALQAYGFSIYELEAYGNEVANDIVLTPADATTSYGEQWYNMQ